MKWTLWLLGAVVVICWGIPLVKYIVSRLWVYVRLVKLRLIKHAYVVFRHPFSLWAFHRSKHADVLVVCDRQAFLVKFGGAFKRATRLTAITPCVWRQERLWRSVGPMSAPLWVNVFTRDMAISFDLVDDTVRLRTSTHRVALLDEYTPVYMLTPKPLSLAVAEEGGKRELSNGDELFGMTLYTAKRFFRVCRALESETLTKAEKKALKTAFRK